MFIWDLLLSTINIKTYLQIIGKSKERLFPSIIERFKQNDSQHLTITTTSSTNTSDTSASTSCSDCTTSTYIYEKRRISIGSIDEHAAELKKSKSNLIKVHSELIAMDSESSPEINAYSQITVACDNVLQYGKNCGKLISTFTAINSGCFQIEQTNGVNELAGLMLNTKKKSHRIWRKKNDDKIQVATETVKNLGRF